MIYCKIPIKVGDVRVLRLHGDKIDKVFSGRRPRQANYNIHRFGEKLHLLHQAVAIHITLMLQKQEKQQETIKYFNNTNYK